MFVRNQLKFTEFKLLIMKKLRVLLSFLTLCFFFNCENEPIDSTVEPGNSNSSAFFQVDFNGQTYQADVASAGLMDNMINLTAVKNNGETFTLSLFGNSVGTYELGVIDLDNLMVPPNTMGYYNQNDQEELEENAWVSLNAEDPSTPAGTVTITEINSQNNTISGSFSFTGMNDQDGTIDTIEFINGIFTNIPFETGWPGSGNEDDNTFYAEIDGEEFVEDVINIDILESELGDGLGILASKNNMETILVSVPLNISPGQHDFTAMSMVQNPMLKVQYSQLSNPTNIALLEGSISISLHDTAAKHIVGTFECSGATTSGSDMNITNGSFDIYYE